MQSGHFNKENGTVKKHESLKEDTPMPTDISVELYPQTMVINNYGETLQADRLEVEDADDDESCAPLIEMLNQTSLSKVRREKVYGVVSDSHKQSILSNNEKIRSPSLHIQQTNSIKIFIANEDSNLSGQIASKRNDPFGNWEHSS
jgi:hypothetical protein